MPLRPAVAGTTKSQFLVNLEVGYDFDLAPVGVATALGLPPSPFPRTLRIQSNAGAMDAWTWLLGGQSFTREAQLIATLSVEVDELELVTKGKKRIPLKKTQVGPEKGACWEIKATGRVSPEEPTQRWPNTKTLDTLHPKFKENVQAFINALQKAKPPLIKGGIRIGNTLRPAQIGYIFYWCNKLYKVQKNGKTTNEPPRFRSIEKPSVDDATFPLIDWRCASAYVLRHNIMKAVAEYDPPKKVGNHMHALAIDMNIPLVALSKKTSFRIEVPHGYWELTRSRETGAIQEKYMQRRDRNLPIEEVELIFDPAYSAPVGTSPRDLTSGCLFPAECEFLFGAKGIDKEGQQAWVLLMNDATRETLSKGSIDQSKNIVTKEQLAAAEEKHLADEVTRLKRPLNKEEEQKARLQAQDRVREKALRAQRSTLQEAKEAAFANLQDQLYQKRLKEGNWWANLHFLAENYFGVIHFINAYVDPMHWSASGR